MNIEYNRLDRQEILLSIIVPVYNVEKYLRDCLDSLLYQDLSKDKYEIICVDDGSTDSSGKILDDYAKKYSNIIVIHKENGGVSSARNRGLDQARGRYVYFCDSDDCVNNIFLLALNILIKHKGESCSFMYKKVNEDYIFKKTCIKQPLVFETNKKRIFYHGCVYQFIFDRQLIIKNNLSFIQGMQYGEDELFIWQFCRFLNFKKHIYINEIGYNYRQRDGSLLHTAGIEKVLKHYNCMKTMAKEYKNILQNNCDKRRIRNETKKRYRYAVSNALYDGLFIKEKSGKEIILDLKSEKIYPYMFYWRLLKPKKGIKTMLSNYFRFLFPIKWYYIICKKVLR